MSTSIIVRIRLLFYFNLFLVKKITKILIIVKKHISRDLVLLLYFQNFHELIYKKTIILSIDLRLFSSGEFIMKNILILMKSD